MNLKVPPHNLQAEQIILCACLTHPEFSIPICMEQLMFDDFYRTAHQIIYGVIIQERGKLIAGETIGILVNALIESDELEKIGGQDYLYFIACIMSTPSAIQYYIDIILELSRKRKMLALFSTVSEGVNSIDSSEIYSLIKYRIEEINQTKSLPIIPMKSAISNTFKEIEKATETEGIMGIPSGLLDIDKITNGWQNGDLIIIAGRPGMGKSVICKDCAESSNVPVLYFPIEMSVSQTQKRQIAGLSGIDIHKILSGHLTNNDWQKIIEVVQVLNEMPIYYIDKGYLTIEEVIAISHQAYKKYNIGMVIIDYLQLLKQKAKTEKREQEISEISRQLKGLARDLNIPVIVASQLNRECEKRSTKKPMLSDLRESGSIEADADVVGLLYRADYYFKNTDRGIAEFIIAKGRNIKTGTIKLFFDGEKQKFRNYVEGYDENF